MRNILDKFKTVIGGALLLVATLIALLLSPTNAFSQGTAYVNSETILSAIPQYKVAEEQIERLRSSYEKELDEELTKLENLFASYQKEKLSLTAQRREEREQEIILRERQLKEREEEFFGEEGKLALRSKELLEPIREAVQKAVDAVAKERGIILLFDVSMLQGVIFKDPSGDLSQEVLKKLEKK